MKERPSALRAGSPPGQVESSRCSFCEAEVGDHVVLKIPVPGTRRRDFTGFCSTRCRDCVAALAALHPPALSTTAFLERRALLCDRLLDLWRHGKGPDPALVLQAAEKARLNLAA